MDTAQLLFDNFPGQFFIVFGLIGFFSSMFLAWVTERNTRKTAGKAGQ